MPNHAKYDSLRLEERDNSGHLTLRVMHEVAQEGGDEEAQAGAA
jgi:hypothetical protein